MMNFEKFFISIILVFCSWFASPAGLQEFENQLSDYKFDITYFEKYFYAGHVDHKKKHDYDFNMANDTLFSVPVEMLTTIVVPK